MFKEFDHRFVFWISIALNNMDIMYYQKKKNMDIMSCNLYVYLHVYQKMAFIP